MVEEVQVQIHGTPVATGVTVPAQPADGRAGRAGQCWNQGASREGAAGRYLQRGGLCPLPECSRRPGLTGGRGPPGREGLDTAVGGASAASADILHCLQK